MRIGNIGWAAIGSVALHAGLFGMFWPHTPPRVATTSPVVMQAELVTDTTHSQPSGPSEAPTLATAPAASAPSRPVTPPPATPPAEPELPNLPVQAEEPANTGYLPIEAVDQPAMPLGDWVIDTDALPHGYTLRMVLKLWISAGGTIDHWDLVGDTANPVLAEKALTHLDQTPIQPALLNQVAVPSLRQLEVVVTRE